MSRSANGREGAKIGGGLVHGEWVWSMAPDAFVCVCVFAWELCSLSVRFVTSSWLRAGVLAS